jgi:hypothetical protein
VPDQHSGHVDERVQLAGREAAYRVAKLTKSLAHRLGSLKARKTGKRVRDRVPDQGRSPMYIGVGTILLIILIILLIAFVF